MIEFVYFIMPLALLGAVVVAAAIHVLFALGPTWPFTR